jgi:cysteinyl-tRNA synthetase
MKVFDTLSGQKTDFKPEGKTVNIYVCGVTVYDECHIGHAMSYVIFDAVRRYLEFRGYKVKHVQNFTDIDDKIINRANQLGISSAELAEKYINEYFKDMDALNIKRAHVYPKATEEIPKIIEVIQGLIDKGFAYESGGSVYFRVKNFPGYGKLSHQALDDIISRSCSVEEGKKEYPLDFALWKATKPGEPFWPSPWGQGRPGWHIECSAMALKYLGKTLDIHGGGQDLIFPHHENEITQSESFTGVVPFARHWLHNGLLQLGENKMSKSLGNLITVKQALELYSSDAIRLFILNSHYRSPLTYSEEALKAAESGMERLRQAARDAGEADGSALDVEPYKSRFMGSMDDDFNTAQALAAIFELAREINRGREEKCDVSAAQNTLRELTGVLGFTLEEPKKPPLESGPFITLLSELSKEFNQTPKHDPEMKVEQLVQLLIETREKLRKAKQWQLADMVRQRLTGLGIALEDTPKGTIWKRTL